MALDAIGEESLRRVGTSTRELQTGFSVASASAINDIDALAVRPTALGVSGEQAGALLARSLTAALTTAIPQQAIDALIVRWQALGDAGTVTGRQLADGLEAARAKAEALTPGIQSLDEAMRTFGIKSRDEMQATAATLGEAFQRIANSAQVSVADQRKAFDEWAAAAIAANNGIEPSFVTVQRRMIETREIVAGLGSDISDAMDAAGASVDAFGERIARATSALQQLYSASGSIDQRNHSDLSVLGGGPPQNAVDNTALFSLIAKQQSGTLGSDDLASAQAVLAALKQNAQVNVDAQRSNAGAISLTGQADMEANIRRLENIVASLGGRADGDASSTISTGPTPSPAPARAGTSAPTPSPAPAPSPAVGGSTTHIVTINVGPTATSIRTASASDSEALAGVLRSLETARSTAASGGLTGN